MADEINFRMYLSGVITKGIREIPSSWQVLGTVLGSEKDRSRLDPVEAKLLLAGYQNIVGVLKVIDIYSERFNSVDYNEERIGLEGIKAKLERILEYAVTHSV